MPDRYLLIKNGYFYRPGRAGYTASKAEAGVYSRQEAEEACRLSDKVSMLAHDHAEEVAPICTPGMMTDGMPRGRFQELMTTIREAIDDGRYDEARKLTFCD
jgi:hypothetical protein